MSTRQTEIRRANLGTKWEQYWRYQPNATTISEEQVSIVTGLKTKTLSIAATCFQYHEYGRRAGLKIRWGNTRVGSSPTFGTEFVYTLSTTRTPLSAAGDGVPSKMSRIRLMTPVRPSRFRGRTGLASGSPRK